ncbi:MAG: hypothetical protein AB9M53_02130, partial [Leptothrix sp. (in: b-proteobacteria)]
PTDAQAPRPRRPPAASLETYPRPGLLSDAQRVNMTCRDAYFVSAHAISLAPIAPPRYSSAVASVASAASRETNDRRLTEQVAKIIAALVQAAGEVAKLVEEGERQAAIPRQEWGKSRDAWLNSKSARGVLASERMPVET